MKEIGKLIELLNEYEKETKKSEYSEWRDLLGGRPQYLRCDTVESELLIISKGYHFIEWLVENNKIDNKKIADKTYVKVNGELYEVILGCHYDLYQQTLMLLSISDTPIEDLISYLK